MPGCMCFAYLGIQIANFKLPAFRASRSAGLSENDLVACALKIISNIESPNHRLLHCFELLFPLVPPPPSPLLLLLLVCGAIQNSSMRYLFAKTKRG